VKDQASRTQRRNVFPVMGYGRNELDGGMERRCVNILYTHPDMYHFA